MRPAMLLVCCGLLWVMASCGSSHPARMGAHDGGGSGLADGGGPRDSGSRSEPDAAQPARKDGGPEIDGRVPSGCEEAQRVFSEFVAAHRTCETDDDCEVIGDCGPNADFAVVRSEFAEQARKLQLARCSAAYDGPMYLPVCRNGVCAREEDPNDCCGCYIPAFDDVRASKETWDSLPASSRDAYWYEEVNCSDGSADGAATRVQVQNGVARIIDRQVVPGSECAGGSNRYEDFTAKTMEQLYDECEALLGNYGKGVTVRFDEQGVLAACFIRSTDRNCRDACGAGFVLTALEFGAPGDEDAGRP